MTAETEWMKGLLPSHYTCEPRDNGVHCYSNGGGIEDSGPEEHWSYVMAAIRQKFGARFQEVDHQTCTNHQKFTVYLKPA